MLDTLLSNDVVALCGVITAGLLLGRVTLAGLSLGSSGVIFAALALGRLGYDIPAGAGALGLVLFVYCVGIRAGPSFFRGFVRQGRSLAKLAAALTALGAVATWGIARVLGIPADLAAGVTNAAD